MIQAGSVLKKITNLPSLGEAVLFVSLVFEYVESPLTGCVKTHNFFTNPFLRS